LAKEQAVDATKAPEKNFKRKKEFKKKREKRVVPHGVAHIQATFNNTIITICGPDGRTVSWSSAGSIGFKGSRKGTPYAAQQASGTAAGVARDQYGMKSIEVRIKGPGSGRESAVRASLLPDCTSCTSRTSRRFRTTAAARPSAGASDRVGAHGSGLSPRRRARLYNCSRSMS